ncbi:hypothetical protein DPMN_171723 [Dreissena polymorpha]|uniref:Uncharacterized protein n=2 Tax=Dreissena polymorpha TaxID=45954 RepID=A0A9D4ICN9_DREPO|nr:hypothetical protein DPMN_171723 [Dreissena polymorpha]
MTDEHDASNTTTGTFRYSSHAMFNRTILEGCREANANGHSDFSLKHSPFYFDKNNIIDLHKIWKKNAANAIALNVDMKVFENRRISPANDVCVSHIAFDLHSCMKITHLELTGHCILVKGEYTIR